ncbi:MAG: FixH family protein [Chloroflexota bacterium]|nr:FixH family protein [Chloroflexota bacterium]
MRIRPFFWYLLAFVCVSMLLFAASNQTYAPAILQVHVDQEKLTAAGITTLELHLADPQGVPIDEAHVLPDARMTNMDMQASYSNVSAIGKGQYKVEFRLYMAGPWLITLHANADGFRPLEQTLQVNVM